MLYPATERSVYDRIVEAVARSYRAGRAAAKALSSGKAPGWAAGRAARHDRTLPSPDVQC